MIEEDPTLRFRKDAQTNEFILAGMGETHLEVAVEKLKRQYSVEVELRTPKIAYFDDAVLNKNYGEKMRESLDRETEELRRELNGILQEQDVELRDMLYRYDFAIGECRELAGKTSCDDVRTTALNMEQQLRRRRDMAELELLLASSEPGERGQFHALARKFVDENKYRDYVNLLRAMDFAERRDPRSALYALRQAARDNPDNPAVREMLKSIELGYLKAIDSKITGEAADVRARLWESLGEHGEEGHEQQRTQTDTLTGIAVH